MRQLEKYWARVEEEEREKRRWREFKKQVDEHYERVRDAGDISPWAILFIVLLFIASSIYFVYGLRRGMREYRPPAVNPPAVTPAQGQPPQNTKPKRRARTQVPPASERN
jgi:hypothetical protein